MKHTNTTPDIPVLYEDEHLMVINKPVNVLSQPDHTGDADVLSLCKEYLNNQNSGSSYLGLVHRLDRPVGGLMLLAKTSHAAKKLSRQIKDRTIQKTYWAVTFGEPPQNSALTHHLIKDREKNIVRIASGDQRKSRQAILSFDRIESSKDLNLLAVHLHSGRPHQIRVQLSTEGYPVWGDYKYGPDQPDGRDIALRAVELVFNHPETEEEVRFELSPPNTEPWNRFNIVFS